MVPGESGTLGPARLRDGPARLNLEFTGASSASGLEMSTESGQGAPFGGQPPVRGRLHAVEF